MKTIKVSEADRHVLDWLVAKCEEATDKRITVIRREDYIGHPIEREAEAGSCTWEWWAPSRIWSQGGPIIEREGIAVVPMAEGWEAQFEPDTQSGLLFLHHGPTPLIAAMRCYVASKLGDTVEVPEELV